MKHCEKYEELISGYVDGELSEAEVSELEAHLASCGDCRRALEFYRTLHSLEQESMAEPPAALHGSIMNAVKREKRRPFVRAIPALVGSLAACLAIAVGVGHFGGFGGSNETAGADTMLFARSMDTTAKSESVAAPVSANGIVTDAAGAGEQGEVAFDDAPAYNAPVEYSLTVASSAAYDPNEAVESPFAPAQATAKQSDALSEDIEFAHSETSDPQPTPAPQGDSGVAATTDEAPEEAAAETTADNTPRRMTSARTPVVSAVSDGRIVIDADAVVSFSYDNRMYELSDPSDDAEMRRLLDMLASFGLTPLDTEPNVDGREFIGVTAWLDDGSMRVFVYYPDGYIVEGDTWYSFE